MIKFDSKGKIFYQATRVGQFGKIFRMWKFRTMVEGADLKGPSITVSDDARVTRIGKILRKNKIDELPSFLNVFWGNMSVVGPRPECIEWVNKYSEREREVLLFKPGITGPSQLKFRNEEQLLVGENWTQKYLELMREKISTDLRYYSSNSFVQDLRMIFKTIF